MHGCTRTCAFVHCIHTYMHTHLHACLQLVTLNTRLVEAEENKKNYELYILRMKEEDVQLSKQIDHLRNLVVRTRAANNDADSEQ